MAPLYQDCTLLHVDADGFFAAVEQALDPALRGRLVVTGAEQANLPCFYVLGTDKMVA